jgi:hypothetical protein
MKSYNNFSQSTPNDQKMPTAVPKQGGLLGYQKYFWNPLSKCTSKRQKCLNFWLLLIIFWSSQRVSQSWQNFNWFWAFLVKIWSIFLQNNHFLEFVEGLHGGTNWFLSDTLKKLFQKKNFAKKNVVYLAHSDLNFFFFFFFFTKNDQF